MAREWLPTVKDDPNLVVTFLDVANAFNTVHRRAVYDRLEAEVPTLLPHFRLLYGTPAPLFVRGPGDNLVSAEGLRQGDPLSPFYFCLVLRHVMDQVRAALPANAVLVHLAIADDQLFVRELNALSVWSWAPSSSTLPKRGAL